MSTNVDTQRHSDVTIDIKVNHPRSVCMENWDISTTELETQKQAEIDAAFAAMADDAEYQTEALKISEEFASADWEALQIGESQRRS